MPQTLPETSTHTQRETLPFPHVTDEKSEAQRGDVGCPALSDPNPLHLISVLCTPQ